MYQSYEEDLQRILNNLQKRVNNLTSQSTDSSQSGVSEGNKEIEEAEKCVMAKQLRQMEIELAVMAPSFKSSLSSQCRKYKETLESFKRSLKLEETRASDSRNKESLMGPAFNSGFSNQREKLLHPDNAMFAGVSKLEEAKRAGYSAEGYAVQSMNELKGQREKLEHAIQNNREISDNLSQGTRILNSMIRRNIQNKLVMFGIAFLLICAIVFLIYMKLS